MNKIRVYPRSYPRISASTPKIIAFDFDRTLFDTERFKIALAKSLKKYSIPPEIWWETYKSSIPAGLEKYQIYQPEKHAKIIQKLTGVGADKISETFNNVIKQSSKLLYKETLPVLKFFTNHNFTLYLVSFGNCAHQREKIYHSGIAKFFDKIIISDKPKAYIKFPDKTIVVDDNVLEIKNLYKKYKNRLTLVWLNRENKKMKLPKSVIEIKNLKSLIKILS